LIGAGAELLIAKFGYRRIEANKGYLRTVGSPNGPVVVDDLTTALNKMNPVDWRGDYEGWFALLMSVKAVGGGSGGATTGVGAAAQGSFEKRSGWLHLMVEPTKQCYRIVAG
jgi:hypothetical protein